MSLRLPLLLIVLGIIVAGLGIRNQNMQTRKLGVILFVVGFGLLIISQSLDISIFPEI